MALPLNPTTSTSVVNAVVEFKTPIGALPPRRKRKVLDEDTYVQRMAEIIQRDFFPDLEKLQVQNEYLEALEANDIHKLREIHSKYSLGKKPATDRPDASPATFDTPLFSDNDSDESRIPDNISVSNMHVKKKSVAGSESGKMEESLDLFLAKYTSEDNESFEEIVEEAEKKRRFKYAWLYNNEEEKKQMNDAALALPSIEEQAIEGKRPAQIDTWKYNTKNYIMYVPDGAPLTAEEKMALVLEKQVITHRNTRYNSLPWDDKRQKQVLKQAASLQAKCSLGGKVDVDGKEMQIPSTPSVNGFSFMKTPSPAPGVEDTPFMTWGEIEGTPFRLDGSDTPLITHSSSSGPAFRMQEPSSRDRLGVKLAEKVVERYRDRKGKALQTAKTNLIASPSGGVLQRLSTMSPAARQLATSKLGIRLTTDPALQASYTPSPRRRSHGTPTPSRSLVGTPKQGTPRTPSSTRGLGDTLTDNLLRIPNRVKAAEFF